MATRKPPLRDSAVGTTWRTFRSFLVFVVVVFVVYALFSVMVAVTTADKCDTSGGHFNASKTWNYFPPRWDCSAPFQGPG